MGDEHPVCVLGLGTLKPASLNRLNIIIFMEATGGFEPPNRGFADLRLSPLGYVAPRCRLGAEGGI